MREEKGKKMSHLCSWWKIETYLPHACFISLFVFKKREWRGKWMVRNHNMVTAWFPPKLPHLSVFTVAS